MTETLRGQPIYWDGGQYRYRDNNEPTIETWKSRPCGHCGLHFTPEGHDGCLGELPGVMNACCGHGNTDEAYVQFWDGTRLGDKEALSRIEQLTSGRVSTEATTAK